MQKRPKHSRQTSVKTDLYTSFALWERKERKVCCASFGSLPYSVQKSACILIICEDNRRHRSIYNIKGVTPLNGQRFVARYLTLTLQISL